MPPSLPECYLRRTFRKRYARPAQTADQRPQACRDELLDRKFESSDFSAADSANYGFDRNRVTTESALLHSGIPAFSEKENQTDYHHNRHSHREQKTQHDNN